MALKLIQAVLMSVLFLVTVSTGEIHAGPDRRVIILGVDGLDPKLLQQFLDSGHLPNFQKLIAQGDFRPLKTTMPPLSPVAWSTFITGMDAGGHGIFDFVHRDPATLQPMASTSKTEPPTWRLTFGSWDVPLAGGDVVQMRRGKAFWQILEAHGVPTQIFRMPANFPPSPSPGKSFSGMGTPDVLGTPGTFSFYTTHPPEGAEEISGGQVFKIEVRDHRVQAALLGPENPVRRKRNGSGYTHPRLQVDFEVFLDPEQPVAKFVVQDNEFILNVGEWSDWVRIDFEAIPYLVNVSATARFYLQEVGSAFRLYVTPLQINPEAPAMPISTPSRWANELQQRLGYFYTQELPEDTKALSAGIFTGREFWDQAQFVYRERRRALDHFLEMYQEGLLFFYFSSVDQGSHMLWRYRDPAHPGYKRDVMLQQGMRILYEQIDEALGHVMRIVDDKTTLVVMSDHGFAPFYWGVNLNSWLVEKGYVKLKDPSRQGEGRLYQNVDWTATTAYALGLNGIYVNLLGREKHGIVYPDEEYDALLDRLEADLLHMVDPRRNQHAVTLVTRTQRDLTGAALGFGPDLIVGYNHGYRSSWQSPLGEFPKAIFVDNHEAWSGDHSVDHRLVPGVLITNQKISLDEPALYDLTVAVLDEYGIAKLPDMIGQDCLAPKQP
ncbi:MAG: hypothetical protein ETSY1_10470 [Candidatus Entotheonella factor]|uniref:Phosphodiesterase n=1 Tax=Entotheonella factor TaxID=1429438 RepID=W4LRW3_ENTF1|nr:MAG: hypothetical protein ETSY1_10470 [Candidatus Entotheonella factor]